MFLYFLLLGVAVVNTEIVRYDGETMTVTMATSNGRKMEGRAVAYPTVPIALGDMLFTEESWMLWNSPARGIIQDEFSRWPKDGSGNVVVPYEIGADYGGSQDALLKGMQQWSNKTCIRFYPRAEVPAEPPGQANNYVVFQNGQGCSSYVGMISMGPQPVTLGQGCDTAEVIAHELGHALGFGHEHQRPDRDDYLTIFNDNVINSFMSNFDKDTHGTYDVPYNYLSNMHYFWNIFAIDSNKPTMMPKDPSMKFLLENNNPVSHYDALTANRAFGCEASWKAACGASAPTCMNFGYLGPDCQCVCPEGTSGVDCGTKTATSLPVYPAPACGGKINIPGDHSVPGTGAERLSVIDCTWFVEAPTCKIAQVKISSFNLNSKASSSNEPCYYDRLSIASQNVYIPDVGPLCGGSAVVPDGTTYTGQPSLTLYFRSWTLAYSLATGFNFHVDFLDDPTCTPTNGPSSPTTTMPQPPTTTGTVPPPPPPSTLPPPPPPSSAPPSTTTMPPPPPSTTTLPPPPPPSSVPTSTTTMPPPPPPTTTVPPPPPPTTTKPPPPPPTTTIPPPPPPTSTKSPVTVTTMAPASLEKCTLKKVNNKTFIWTSPGFPAKAPANSRCTLLSTTTLSGFDVSFNFFKVAADSLCSNAYVLFIPTFPQKRLCNNKTGLQLKIYRKFSVLQYQSNPLYSSTGFNITITAY